MTARAAKLYQAGSRVARLGELVSARSRNNRVSSQRWRQPAGSVVSRSLRSPFSGVGTHEDAVRIPCRQQDYWLPSRVTVAKRITTVVSSHNDRLSLDSVLRLVKPSFSGPCCPCHLLSRRVASVGRRAYSGLASDLSPISSALDRTSPILKNDEGVAFLAAHFAWVESQLHNRRCLNRSCIDRNLSSCGPSSVPVHYPVLYLL